MYGALATTAFVGRPPPSLDRQRPHAYTERADPTPPSPLGVEVPSQKSQIPRPQLTHGPEGRMYMLRVHGRGADGGQA